MYLSYFLINAYIHKVCFRNELLVIDLSCFSNTWRVNLPNSIFSAKNVSTCTLHILQCVFNLPYHESLELPHLDISFTARYNWESGTIMLHVMIKMIAVDVL
jgi:hypothetical protein